MAGVSRLGLDSSGGMVITASQDVLVNGVGCARLGDIIESHGDSPHDSPIIVTGSPTVFVNGIPMAREGDSSSCGHQLSGSSNVFTS